MSLSISDRCLQISPSVTLSIDARAKFLRAQGVDVISFGAGEPDFDTPLYIRQAAQRAIDTGQTRYTPVAGTLALREQIAGKLKKISKNYVRNGTEWEEYVITKEVEENDVPDYIRALEEGNELDITHELELKLA